MFCSGILECREPGELLNNYTIGSDIEVNPEIHNRDFTKSWTEVKKETCTMVSVPDLNLKQTLGMVKLAILMKSTIKVIVYLIFKAKKLSWMLE